MHTQGWVLLAGAVVVVALLIESTRNFLTWLIKSSGLPLFSVVKHVMHVIIRAHHNVLRNFLPRTRIFYELNRDRTSHTGE